MAFEYITRVRTTLVARDEDADTGETIEEREPDDGDWRNLGLLSGAHIQREYESWNKGFREMKTERDDAVHRAEVEALSRAELQRLTAAAQAERDAARAEVERLKAAHALSHPAADLAAAANSPLPDGVPGEIRVSWYRVDRGPGSLYETQHESGEHYLHASLVAAKVAEEREACVEIMSTLASENWSSEANAMAVAGMSRIRARGKP